VVVIASCKAARIKRQELFHRRLDSQVLWKCTRCLRGSAFAKRNLFADVFQALSKRNIGTILQVPIFGKYCSADYNALGLVVSIVVVLLASVSCHSAEEWMVVVRFNREKRVAYCVLPNISIDQKRGDGGHTVSALLTYER